MVGLQRSASSGGDGDEVIGGAKTGGESKNKSFHAMHATQRGPVALEGGQFEAGGITASLLHELATQKDQTANLKTELARAQAGLALAKGEAEEAALHREKLQEEVKVMRSQRCSDGNLVAKLAACEDQVLGLRSQLRSAQMEEDLAQQRASALENRARQLEQEICKVFTDAERSCSRWEGVCAELQSQCQRLETQLEHERTTVDRLVGTGADGEREGSLAGLLSECCKQGQC